MSSILVKKLFPNAIVLNDTLDGAFPSHSPNPLKSEAREELSRIVRECKLDCGVIFDGDADRAMFVDENGFFIQPDYLIPALAEECLASSSSGRFSKKVLHDVRTSRAVIEALQNRGFEPVMVPVGHAFAKPKMHELNALCGGELAGHYYFGDFFGCDSGVLTALRVLLQIAKAKNLGRTFSEMMHPVTDKYANSGELNFKVDDKSAAIRRVLEKSVELSKEVSRSEIDGVRIDFVDGWINVRQSNTEPYLRLIAEFDSKDKMSFVVSALSNEISK
jgi:phosphomannomutase